MDMPNWITSLRLFMAYPVLMIATFLIASAAFAFAWWLRSNIGQGRVDALNERLTLAREEQAAVTREVEKLQKETAEQKTAIERLRNIEAVRHEFEALAANSASVANTVASLSSVNEVLGTTLGVMSGRFQLIIDRPQGD